MYEGIPLAETETPERAVPTELEISHTTANHEDSELSLVHHSLGKVASHVYRDMALLVSATRTGRMQHDVPTILDYLENA